MINAGMSEQHNLHVLMTSVSIVSRSFSAACGRITGGGCSITEGVEGRDEVPEPVYIKI